MSDISLWALLLNSWFPPAPLISAGPFSSLCSSLICIHSDIPLQVQGLEGTNVAQINYRYGPLSLSQLDTDAGTDPSTVGPPCCLLLLSESHHRGSLAGPEIPVFCSQSTIPIRPSLRPTFFFRAVLVRDTSSHSLARAGTAFLRSLVPRAWLVSPPAVTSSIVC